MGKIIKLNENELLSLIKKILTEDDDIQKKSHRGKLSFANLSQSQKNKIKVSGMKVFDDIKNFVDPKTNKNINYWLKQNGLQLKVPSEEFLKKNIDDINFVFNNFELSKIKKIELEKNLEFLKSQLENPESKIILLFHEENGEWSVVNMFDNNLKLWIKLINNYIDHPNSEINIDEFLDEYFSGGTNSNAAHDLLRAMLVDRESHRKTIFSTTLDTGQKVEDNFFKNLISLGLDPSNIRVFSGGGNFVDRVGFDGAIRCGNRWFPVQVKSNEKDVYNTIPYKGICVYPKGNVFYYVHDKTKPANLISSLIEKCI